jgi:uncharacterized protein YcfL
MKLLAAGLIGIFLALMLAGCQTPSQNVIQTKLQVVMPEAALFNCPQLKSLPSASKLTDVQVARLIVQLYKNNVACKNSIDAIKNYLEEAQKLIDGEVKLS